MARNKTTTSTSTETSGTTTETKPVATRVYVVTDKETGKPVALIDTNSEAKARAHHFDKRWTVKYAEQKDMFAAAKEGVEIERASDRRTKDEDQETIEFGTGSDN